MNERYDVEVASTSKAATGSIGRNVIAVIGIDRYHHWRRLSNAVRDATSAAALFRRLGFEEVTAPLLDDHATGKAIQSLVTDDLMTLGPDDSLVLFYAGHGGTRKHRLGDEVIKTGYLIPVDASGSTDKVSTWIDLEGWLRAASLLPAKHILVVLDACHSGIALDPIIKWRDIGTWQGAPLATLQARRSRRIITSALDDQVALDSGPVHGHSLFTGCLIEGLTHGIGRDGSRVTTGSELGLYVQRRVQTYPHSRQTPDFGTFAFDDRGEMVIPLAIDRLVEPAAIVETRSDDEVASDAEADGAEAHNNSITTAQPAPVSMSQSTRRRKPTPILPLRSPTPETAATIAPTPEPAEPASEQPVPRPTPERRRHKRSTPIVPPLPRPQQPTEVAEPTVSTPGARRWIVVGAVGTTFATALIGHVIFGQESSWGDSPVDTSSHVAVSNPLDAPPDPPDAPPVIAASVAALDGPPYTQSQPSGARAGDCPPAMVPVPAGTFRMGSPEGVGDTDEHPQHEVTLSAYCIDKTEVTVEAYAACVAAKGCSAAPLTVRWSGYSAADVKRYSRFCNRGDRPEHPINCVDWNQAAAYCKWADKRLPSEAEWEYAARGNDGRAYPWGNEAPSAMWLNACGTECVAMAKHELNQDWAKLYDTSDRWDTTALVGSFPEGASPLGALDMAGNVWEWTADWYGAYSGARALATNPRGAKTGTGRVLRGGAWKTSGAGHVRVAHRIRHKPSIRDDNVGFRCARGPTGT